MLSDPEGLGKLVKEIQAAAIARRSTVATAESCTGGLLAFLLTRWSGSSAFFQGGVSAYANAVKTGLLGVEAEAIAREGAVSEAVAVAMAEGARTKGGADFGVSITGIAGPDGGTPQKPVGTVFVGVAGPDGARAAHLELKGNRDRIREAAAEAALGMLRDALKS